MYLIFMRNAILIEPLLMAAAALGVALVGSTQKSWFLPMDN